MDSDGYESDENCYFDDNYYFDDTDNHREVAAMRFSRPDRTSASQSLEKNYTVLTETEIRQRQHEAVSHISSVLSLPPQDAMRLLCYYNWEILHLHDEWFANEQAVRDKVGLLIKTPSKNKTSLVFDEDNTNKVIQCGICFEDFDAKNISSLACGHPYCKTCWSTYIHVAIDDGPGSLFLTCPECKVAVTWDMIDALATKKYREKYDRYFVRSYVECKKERTKWCPAPACDHAIEFEHGGDSKRYNVTCLCSHVFCWNCVEEPHRPVDCELVGKWMVKKTSEAENNKWILAYSKPCPKCKRPIEKNKGCNHMSCSAPCKYEFCWLCLGDWAEHRAHYKCNAYKGPGLLEEKVREEKVREDAKRSLERYLHYYERWAGNHKSRLKAIEDLQKFEKNDLNTLSTMVKKPVTELEFVLEAWEQIIECRRVLKWSYAYGYYLLENEPAKQHFFEYLQGQAEGVLEKLHSCAENELSVFYLQGQAEGVLEKLHSCADNVLSGFLKTDKKLNNEGEKQQSKIISTGNWNMNVNDESAANNMDAYEGPDFGVYRSKLADLTKVTGKYFKDLVRALENGLTEVAIVPNQGPKEAEEENKKKRKGSTSSTQPCRVNIREFNDAANNDDENIADFGEENFADVWTCDRCTCVNPISASSCQACYGGY